jgi:carboxyl-terminal processing protease
MIPRWMKFVGVALALLLVGTLSFAGGFAVSTYRCEELRHPLGETPEEHAEAFRVFWEAWHLVEEDFYSPEADLDPQQMTYGAIRGALASLGDPHTSFAEPAHTAILDEDMGGSFEGIGASVNVQDGNLIIVRLLPDTPALEAGLLAGDVIAEVDGQSVRGMDLMDAIALIRGPEGTIVRLTIERRTDTGFDPEVFEVDIVRKKIEHATVETRMLGSDIAYLRLNEFNGPSADKVKKALQELLDEDPAGLIFDLRDNPGGYLQSAVAIASQFIDEGIILYERGRDGSETEYPSNGKGLATDIPLVILVNGGSASASEIVAGAIQDHQRGILIGSQTLGKGSIQVSHHLSDGSSLHVTVAHWFTPNDERIDVKGLTPDVVVEPTAEDLTAGRDPALDRAQQYLVEQFGVSTRTR